MKRSISAHRRKYNEQKELAIESITEYLDTGSDILLDDAACSISMCCVNIHAVYESAYKCFIDTHLDEMKSKHGIEYQSASNREKLDNEISKKQDRTVRRNTPDCEDDDDFASHWLVRLIEKEVFLGEVIDALRNLQLYNNLYIRSTNEIANSSKHSKLYLLSMSNFDKIFFENNKVKMAGEYKNEIPTKFLVNSKGEIYDYEIDYSNLKKDDPNLIIREFSRDSYYALAFIKIHLQQGFAYIANDIYKQAKEEGEVLVLEHPPRILKAYYEKDFLSFLSGRSMHFPFVKLKFAGLQEKTFNMIELIDTAYELANDSSDKIMKFC